MDIEIDKALKLSLTGSSLLKALQNNSTPVLDLLVREAIQNSLDAAKEDVKKVIVDFSILGFKSKKLNSFFDGIQDSLDNKYPNQTYKSLVISDLNTKGLDGPVSQKGLKSTSEYGNFWKLVYDIQKPQSSEGAGGSWGLGKTIYFRIGIGLVIYYSRIKVDGNKYESRLAATLVEDENKYDKLLPSIKNHIPTGIAWWGELTENKDTVPITDEEYIKELLDIFQITPFSKKETGTKIIIPYINEKQLLNSQFNITDEQDNGIHIPWASCLEDYLEYAIYRWYTPRLFNVYYGEPYLVASINNENIGYDRMPNIYKLIRSLYNKAIRKNEDISSNFFSINNIPDDNVCVDDIFYKNVGILESPQIVGTFASIKVSKRYICPNREPDPYTFFNVENSSKKDSEVNAPIILYTRKPGMIVNYEVSRELVQTIEDDEYLIGIFVANQKTNFNSNCCLDKDVHTDKKLKYTVEEYFRKSELADHLSWNDFPIIRNDTESQIFIIKNLFKNIKDLFQSNFSEKKEDENKSYNSMLGEIFGKMLLPPLDFGDGASLPSVNKKSNKNNGTKHCKKTSFNIDENGIEYRGNSVFIPATIQFVKDFDTVRIELKIDGEGEGISCDEWENILNLDMPFYLSTFNIKNRKDEIILKSNEFDKFESDGIEYSFIYSSQKVCNGILIKNNTNIATKIDIIFDIAFSNKDYKPTIITNIN